MLSSFALTLIAPLSSYSAYLLGKRLLPSSGIRQMPLPSANERPQWQYSFTSFETFTIVCRHDNHAWEDEAPAEPAFSSKSRMSCTPLLSSRWLISRAE